MQVFIVIYIHIGTYASIYVHFMIYTVQHTQLNNDTVSSSELCCLTIFESCLPFTIVK